MTTPFTIPASKIDEAFTTGARYVRLAEIVSSESLKAEYLARARGTFETLATLLGVCKISVICAADKLVEKTEKNLSTVEMYANGLSEGFAERMIRSLA